MSTTQSNSRKRKTFSIVEKIHILERLKSGTSRTYVCKEHGVSESTLRGWIKDEEKLRESISTMEEPDHKRKRHRSAQDEELDNAVYTWFIQQRAEGTPISGPNIQDQAARFNKMLHPEDNKFQASNGWLRNFKMRHSIHQVSIHGEQRSADEAAAEKYPAQLKKIIIDGDYRPDQIYNCDETALYYKLLPDKTLAQKSDKTKTLGYKQQKERLTALLCTNSSGTHKLKPLIIGKFENPRCLHHINRDALPTYYAHSKNAWMTSFIFDDWFHKKFVPEVRRHLKSRNLQPKAILLVDNCAAHPQDLKSKDGKIVISFLPKNTTSKIQPMDMGIIATTKRSYRRHLVQAIIDSEKRLIDFIKKINIKDAMSIFAAAWADVTKQCVNRCWMKGLQDAFPIEDNDSDDDFEGFDEEDLQRAMKKAETFEGEDLLQIREILGDLTHSELEDWVKADDDEQTNGHMTDIEIINKIAADNEGEEKSDDEEEDEEPKPSMKNIVKSIEVALSWMETSAGTTSTEILHFQNVLRRAKKEARESCRQRKLTDFFM